MDSSKQSPLANRRGLFYLEGWRHCIQSEPTQLALTFCDGVRAFFVLATVVILGLDRVWCLVIVRLAARVFDLVIVWRLARVQGLGVVGWVARVVRLVIVQGEARVSFAVIVG